MEMVLHEVRMLNGESGTIRIGNGRITQIEPAPGRISSRDEMHLHMAGGLVLPGLVNSHDHLEFNLFPQLGNALYRNYVEWGPDIHLQDKSAIEAVLKVPKPLRMQWGMYKNLVAGVTTVMQHGPDPGMADAPIHIFTQSHTLHSVKLEKGWKYKLNKPFAKKYPFVIHIGEGTDSAAKKEIDELIRWNLLHRKLIGIHGVAMSREQAKHFEALVWCPASNYFLLGTTAAVAELKHSTQILFGTDATVSAHWNIWEQLREARFADLLEDEELIDSVTKIPAEVWGLGHTGQVKEGYVADLIVVQPGDTESHVDAFFATDPEKIQLVLAQGRPVLFDAGLRDQFLQEAKQYSRFYIGGVEKYVAGDLPALIKNIKQYHPACQFPLDTE